MGDEDEAPEASRAAPGAVFGAVVSIWTRVRSRKIVQWGGAYVAAAFAAMQGLAVVGDAMLWPPAVARAALALLLAGFPIALTLAWHHGERGRQRFTRGEGALIAIFAVVGVGLATLTLRPTTERVAEPAAENAPRLAVLRFESLGDTEPYFAEGMADELIGEASRIRGIEVTARTSSFALQAADATAAGAADLLGATLVLTGSVRRLPETIRVQAQLVEAPSGRQLWNETFERPAVDVFALQREIAVRVARAAGLRTAEGAARRIDPEAYRLSLEGRELLMRADSQSLDAALDRLRAAVDLEPDFAQAWTDLARAEAAVAYGAYYAAPPGMTLDRDDLEAALAATDTVSRLEGGAGIADVLAADFLSRVGAWTEAAAANDRAEQAGFDAAPRLLLQVGRLREALAVQRRLAELDPLDVGRIVDLASSCGMVRDRGCQRAAAARANAVAPDDGAAIFQLADALTELKETAAARRLLADNARVMRDYFVFTAPFDERYFAWRRGDAPPPDAASILAQVEAGEAYIEAATEVLVVTGEIDAARSLLNDWGPAQWPMLYFLYDSEFAALRAAPEFWALTERAGLLAYWRDSGRWPDFCVTEPVCPME